MPSRRVEEKRSMGSSSNPREQQRTKRQPTQTYNQSFEPENQGTERRSGQTYAQTFTTGSRSTERPTHQTYSQTPALGSRDTDGLLTPTYSQAYTSESQKVQTLSPQPSPPGILSASYVQHKQTQPPKKFRESDEVYIKGEYDASGRPVYRPLRICSCIPQWNKTKKEWEYRVKDLQNNVIGWYTERQLEKMAS